MNVMASVVAHVYVNDLNLYINSFTTHSIKQPSIHQPNSIDIVFTMPRTLGRWNYINTTVGDKLESIIRIFCLISPYYNLLVSTKTHL